MATGKLTDQQREEHWAEFMRQASRTRTVTGDLNKFALRALLDAHDDHLASGGTDPLLLPGVDDSHFAGKTAADRHGKRQDNDRKLAALMDWHRARLDQVRQPAAPAPDVDLPAIRPGGPDGVR